MQMTLTRVSVIVRVKYIYSNNILRVKKILITQYLCEFLN